MNSREKENKNSIEKVPINTGGEKYILPMNIWERLTRVEWFTLAVLIVIGVAFIGIIIDTIYFHVQENKWSERQYEELIKDKRSDNYIIISEGLLEQIKNKEGEK